MWDLTFGNDLYFSIDGNKDKAMGYETAKHKGWIKNSSAADPLFNDAGSFDFELSEGSPALNNGFKRIDYSQAGTKSGSVIGVSVTGGKTPYNKDSFRQNYTAAREKFHPLLIFWYKIVDFFKGIFAK